jgi:hypothetical protein
MLGKLSFAGERSFTDQATILAVKNQQVKEQLSALYKEEKPVRSGIPAETSLTNFS